MGSPIINKSSLPQKIRVRESDIFGQEKIATEFHRIFANVSPGSLLRKHIPKSENTFESYLVKTSVTMHQKSILMLLFLLNLVKGII